jgi:hypothetical protein
VSLIDILGSPVMDPVTTEPPTQHSCHGPDYAEPEPTAPEKRGRLGMALLLVAALIVGTAAGWYVSTRTSDAPSSAEAGPAPLPADIAGFAELYVARHLADAGDPGQASGVWINQAASIGGTQIDDQSWLVTVAVDSLELVDSAYQPVPLQYFDVLIASVGGRPSPIGFPARVPATSATDQSGSLFSDPVPDDQAVAAVTFIDEYLTGGDELNRYLAPAATVVPFDDAPYTDIAARPLGANSLGAIRMAVTATKSNGITHELGYVLTLVLAGDVWVVSSITPVAG